jgi:biotin-(acetyl-CoA carboxylase) ligase
MLVRLGSYQRGGLAELHAELEQHDALFGVPVRVDGLEGVGRGIAEDGALLLEDAHGHAQRVIAGTVEYL